MHLNSRFLEPMGTIALHAPRPRRQTRPLQNPCLDRRKRHGEVLTHRDLPGQAQAARNNVMPMKVREVIRLLEKNGWKKMRSRGSHHHFKHEDHPWVITVPGSEGKELAPGTLNAILKKAGL